MFKKYVGDIELIGKDECERYKNMRFCNLNTIVTHNCCSISTCDKNNITLPTLTLSNIHQYTHVHKLCDECSIKYDKRVFLGNIVKSKPLF